MLNLSKFAERFEELVFYSGKSVKQLSLELGIDRSSLSHYLHCHAVPTINNLVKIADYFKCTTDFLLGIKDNNIDTFKQCPPFCEQIPLLVNKSKLNERNFIIETGVPESCFYDWKNGKRVPTIDNILKIAKYLDCSVDFVLGREK